MKIYRIISVIVALLVILFTLTMLVNAINDKPAEDSNGEAFGWGLGNVILWVLCMIACVPPFLMGAIGFALTLAKQPEGTRLSGILTYLAVALVPALTGVGYLITLKILTT